MSHPFGDLISQYLHRKHGLSQSKLAEGILQAPTVITGMCHGRRLSGPQARERVVAIIGWLHEQGALGTRSEANALLSAADMLPLKGTGPIEARLLQALDPLHEPAQPGVGLGVRLPVDVTPFIGPGRELEQVAERLADPACRLLTVVGPGGIGKSRLAVEAARTAAARFPDGVVFVDLAAVGSPELTAGTLLRELGAPATGEAEAGPRLAAYLRPKRLLLVLDNFEHLLAAGGLLVDLLHAAPGVKLLVTSRARLNLAEEWLVPLEGMEAPPDVMPPGAVRAEQLDLGTWDATRLFGICVARMRPGWMPGQAEVEAVGRICRLLDGNPLGIELAAAWVRTLTVDEIASEVERSLAFLSTSLRDVAPRHRSMAAVFDHSWAMLDAQEQAILRRLSVFRGGWTREAAAEVAGAELAGLAGLVDKSWVRVTAGGRYGMHELVRQYCEEKLEAEHAAESGEPPDAVRRRHCAYYGRFLHLAMPKMNFAREAIGEFMAEFGNAEAGLRWAAQYHDLTALRDISMSLWFGGDMLGWFYYIIQIFQTAIDLLEPEVIAGGDSNGWQEATILQAWMRWPQSALYHQLGASERWRIALECNLARLAHVEPSDDQQYLTTVGWYDLCQLTLWDGDFSRAYQMYDEMRERFSTIRCTYIVSTPEVQQSFWLAHCDTFQGRAAWCLGNFAEGERLTRRAKVRREAIGERRFWSAQMDILVHMLQARGEYMEAEELSRVALANSRSLGDRIGAGFNEAALAAVLRELGRYTEARQHLNQALEIGRQSGQLEILLGAFAELGRVELVEGNLAAARVYCEEALAAFSAARAAHHNSLPAVLNVLGWTELAENQLAPACRLFERVAAMSGSPAVDRMEAQAGLAQATAVQGDVPSALAQFAAVAAHPHTSYALCIFAQQRLADLAHI